MMHKPTLRAVALIIVAWLVFAANRPISLGDDSKKSEPPVAAKVGDEPVYVAEVDDLIARTRAARRGESEAPPELRAEALEQAIHRRLVAQLLAKQGYAVSKDDTDGLVDDLKHRLEAQNLSLDDFLQRHSFSPTILRRQLSWELMWGRYLENELTDAALEKYFEDHRRDYDGTELRVSHILFRVKDPTDNDAVAEVERQAAQVRQQIAAGKLSFADAAAKYSSGPSRRHDGDLGFIPRYDRMTETFSRAAFQLQPDEISGPVTDQFGVHLIFCTAEKPGAKTWQDVRRALAEAWTSQRFLELAEKQRKQTRVEYTDAVPLYDPKTHALVPAAGD